MAQWFALKEQHPDALLFFRMGDFFEMFFSDAEAASSALDIALTHRGEHAGTPIPMCGVPIATADIYLARLIRRGFRVAVAEQMEPASARAGKAPLKRDVVRLITPGTLTEDTLLEAGRPSLLLALAETGDAIGAAWLDVSTGLFETAPVPPGNLAALLGRLDPAEILAPEATKLGDFASRRAPAMAAPPPLAARRRLAEAFGVASLDAFGAFSDAEAAAGALALDYLRLTQAGKLPRLSHPVPTGSAAQMEMDAATRASLELIRTRDGGTDLTLFASVNRTQTAPGARMLAAWITAPLTDTPAIAARQDSWIALRATPAKLASLRQALRGAPDLARALARISASAAAARATSPPSASASPRPPLPPPPCRAICPHCWPARQNPCKHRRRSPICWAGRSRNWYRCVSTTAASSPKNSMLNWMRTANCATTAAASSARCSSISARVRRRQPENQTPRAARIRHRSPGRRGRNVTRLSGTHIAPGHGQRRPFHPPRTRRSGPPH